MAYPGFFSRRTRNDEANLAIDIHHLLQQGSVSEFLYENGQAYLTFVPTILRIMDLPYDATNVLSPFIAALCLSSMVSFLCLVYCKETNDWIGIIPLFAAFFIFAAFIGVLSETSHKAFIYTIVYIDFYILWNIYKGDYDYRQLGILIATLCALAFFNVFWALIFSNIFIIAFIFKSNPIKKPYNVRAYLLFPLMSILTIIAFLPTVTSPPISFYVLLKRLFSGSATTATSAVSAGGFISAWPTMNVAGVEISIWFLYTIGIFFIGVLSAAAFVTAITKLIRQTGDIMDKLLLIFLPLFGLLMMGMLAAGSLPAFRRLMVFPGTIGLLYIMVYVSKKRQRDGGIARYNIITIALVMIICTSTFIAIPRLTPDGNNNPYDHFSDESDISRTLFNLQNQKSGCLSTSKEQDVNTAKIIFGKKLRFNRSLSTSDDSVYHKIYSSDQKYGLFWRCLNMS